MRAPLVSIVTPSLNQGRFIRATIESVLAQDHPHVEYLVIDGGSTDATASIVGEYRDRLTWISEPDRGQAHAINKGFRLARGEVVAWLNSDDLLLPHAASAAVEALEANRGLALVYGDAYVIDEDGFMLGSTGTREPDPWRLANVEDYIAQPAAFLRPWALREIGYLDESLHWCLDWDLFIRLSRRWPTHRISEHLAVARIHDGAKTQSGGLRRFREICALLRRHADRRFPPAFFLYACDPLRPRSGSECNVRSDGSDSTARCSPPRSTPRRSGRSVTASAGQTSTRTAGSAAGPTWRSAARATCSN